MKPIIEYKERGKDWTPLDWNIWGQLYKEENLYSAPTGSRFRFIWTEPSSFLLARRYKKFKVTVHCDFKLNKFMNYKVSMQGVDHRDELSMVDITTGVWLSMFEDYDYNPIRLLIKPPVVPVTTGLKLPKPIHPPAEYDESDFTKTQINDVMKVLQALEYLENVDFWNGRNPLRQMVVKNIYNKYADYQSFWNEYNDSTEFADEVKKQADKLKTPLFRNKFLDRSNKKYVGNRGGMLTNEGEEVLIDWLLKTNQSLDLLDSVKYEA